MDSCATPSHVDIVQMDTRCESDIARNIAGHIQGLLDSETHCPNNALLGCSFYSQCVLSLGCVPNRFWIVAVMTPSESPEMNSNLSRVGKFSCKRFML